jgi:hypothetical protein
MIIRKASEVIRSALTLSQINNSDALSWRDKVDIINQSYVRLYDDLNNNGDIYYAKEMVIEKPEFTNQNEYKFKLPKDFWKLSLVGYKSTMGGIVPIERAPNTTLYFSGYRLINNEIVFSNYFLPGPLYVQYIPQPQTITFPIKGYRIKATAGAAAYDSLNDVIFIGSVSGIQAIDNKNNTTLNRNIDGAYVFAISTGIIYVVKETGIYCFDYQFNELSSLEGEFDLYTHAIGWENGIIVKSNGATYKYVSGGELEESEDRWNFMDGNIVVTELSGNPSYVFKNKEGIFTDITWIFTGIDSFVIADPYIYTNHKGIVKAYYKFEPSDIASALVGSGTRKGAVLAGEVNNESGFGIIFNDNYIGLTMAGYAADSVLNYPQNIFFDWLIADLAVKFRIALDIPTGELPSLAADYHDTLMKGMGRDSYKMNRINNVYGRAYI